MRDCFDAVAYDTLMAGDGDATEKLFELANAAAVRYAVCGGRSVVIRQDPSNTATGGCIWETSYLLAEWAQRELAPRLELSRAGRAPPLRCLEMGAGCGLLGVALAHAGCKVLLTECEESMPNLEANVAANAPAPSPRGGQCAAARLGWGNEADAAAAVSQHGPFDVVLGTDVVFRSALVEPLLRTLWRCCSAADTTCWLCCQVRCPDAHKVLVAIAPAFFARVVWREWDGFSFAEETDAFLLELREPRAAGDLAAGLAAAQEASAAPPPAAAATAAAASGAGCEQQAQSAAAKRAKKASRREAKRRRAEGGDRGGDAPT